MSDDLGRLASDLHTVAVKSTAVCRAVVQKGALNIKNDWRARWTGKRYLPALANSITFDTEITPFGVEAEIGPDKSRPQGPLANLIEYGSVNNAPDPGGAPALDAEAPRFEKALADGIERLL